MADNQTTDFFNQVQAFGQWRKTLVSSIKDFQEWLEKTELDDAEQSLKIYEILQALKKDRLTLAFVGEFSRGKTELINSIFFSQFKTRLLPSEAGRTTMCPTELFYDDESVKPYLKLLPIETRMDSTPLSDHRKDLSNWRHINLDPDDTDSLVMAFAEITEVKKVPVHEAIKLGLEDVTKDDDGNDRNPDELVDIPSWRQAVINFPHPFLKQGLTILDTPGLNSLGNEPELTLSMLPNAQAVVFVLSADTGVTRSDMDIWQDALRNFRRKKTKNSLIIALNKIDTLWDELKDLEQIDKVIKSQCASTSKTLDINVSQVIAVSAQKALLARIRGDQELLKRSNLLAIEKMLAEDIIPQKELILKNTLLSDLKGVMLNDKNIILQKFKSVKQHVDELSNMTGKSQDIVKKLMIKAKSDQATYQKVKELIADSRKKIDHQFTQLNSLISLEKLDQLVTSTRDSMKGSWTTPGLKQAMKIFFDGIQEITDESSKQAELTIRLIESVYKRFSAETGKEKLTPPTFDMVKHVDEVDKLHQEAEDYRNSTLTTMTEQSFVIKNFFITLVSQARNIFYIINREVTEWHKASLTPLNKQLKTSKKEVENRLEQLKQIADSKQTLESQVKKAKQEALGYFNQVKEVDQMIGVMEGKKVQ